MKDLIKSVRISAFRSGGSELQTLALNDGLREIFVQRQKLIAEMNSAQIKAAKEAAQPFLNALEDLDRQYAMILSMTSET